VFSDKLVISRDTSAQTVGMRPHRGHVPSVDETRNTKEHIARLEVELENALILIEETERRIGHIKRDLEEHKLRAAPIRRIPFEILSYIFAICCTGGVLSALRISAVCYRWRSTILATPEAWSRLSSSIPSRIIPTILERSGTRLLHVKLFRDCQSCRNDRLTATSQRSCRCKKVVEFLQPNVVQRTHCLYTPEALMRRLDGTFWAVRHLNLSAWPGGVISVTPLDVSRFPALRSLDISDGLPDPDSLALSRLALPPLEELKFKADIGGAWIMLLQKCAKTLKRFNMRGTFLRHGATTAVIEFPILESLVIYDWILSTGTQLLQATTPTLTSYSYDRYAMVQNTARHKDVANVVHLRTNEIFDISAYPRLRILQLQGYISIMDTFDQLRRNPNICPSLETIQVQSTKWIGDTALQHCKQALQLRNEKTRSDILLIQDDIWHHPIPGCDEGACVSVHSTCLS
jgi:F-box-like